MKIRITAAVAMLLLTTRLVAQQPETVYQGTVIATGFKQNIALASDGPFPVGFSFTYFGTAYTQFYVSANGLVLFTDPDGFYGTEVAIAAATTPNNFIAPFWDNLSIFDGGKILYTTIGAAPNRKCIIQFTNMGFDPIVTPLGTLMVVLYETSNNIQIQYRLIVDPYTAASHGLSATIGLENSTGTAGVQYAFHDGTAVKTEDAILFTPNGGTYDTDDGIAYDGVYLTSNIALPDPKIVSLTSPPPDAVIGPDHTFTWEASTGAASYSLLIDTFPSLATASNFNAGLNLSQNVTGMKVGKTYYWAVFAINATATTWCEIDRFTTASSPPLAAVPMTVWTEQLTDKTITLQYTGGDASPKSAVITSAPSQGALYQCNAGVRGAQISPPVTVSDAAMRVIYAATGSAGNGVGNFNFKVTNSGGESPEATVTVNISPPGVPDVLYVAKSSTVEIQFDVVMADPSGKHGQFTVTVNGTPVTPTSASLKNGDNKTIVLGLASPLAGGETVSVSYTQGDVAGASGGLLFSFTSTPATLLAQTMTFTQSLDKKYSDSPVSLFASATAGPPVSYTSSNLSVATVTSNVLTLVNTGSVVITARQNGNATYAPVTFSRTLNVAKGDQFITFNPLPLAEYGDGDIDPGAFSSSGLPLTYTSNNPLVATIVSDKIHIVGGGNATITATQAGNSLYNPATPADQLLVVNKIDLTFTAENKARVYSAPNPAFTFTIAGFINSETQTVLDQLPTAGTTAIATSDAGTYPITLTGGTDNNYNYIFVPGTLTIGQAVQTISFVDLPVKIPIIKPFILEATSTSNLTVTFESLNPSIASVTGTLLVGVSKGTATIRAYNSGNINWLPAEVSSEIEVLTSHSNIMNLFTPNQDGVNDYWELPDMAEWGKCEVKVYDRRGKLVYDNNDYDNLWDGTSNGAPVPEGAYYYIIVTENNGTVKGTVNVVR